MIIITRRQAIGTMAAGAALAVGFAPSVFAATTAAAGSIDEALAEAVKSGRIPGVVALAANDKGPIYSGAFGVRSLAQSQPMTVDSVFWIASMTKAVTTTAAMQMVEEGKLKLDLPASEILPELASAQVLEGFDAAGSPQLRPAKRPITLRQLLTHTAGYTYDIWNENTGRYEKYANLPGIITCKDDALKTPLAFDPGDRWEYGINIDYAGKMVEKVSGQRLESYFHDRIFGPLGMTDTSFKLSPSQRERLVAMHARGDDGSLKPIEFEMPQEPEFFMGGGGLYSTGPDYLKFVRMFLNHGSLDGKTVLRPETVATMAQNQIGDLRVVMLKTVAPGSSTDAEFFPGMVKKWGLGFMINTETAPTGRTAGSLAWAGLGNTYFWIDPTRNVAGVILMQLLPFGDPRALQAFSEFESRVYKTA
ncbi:MAG TPA: serine hydrolase domain-containing protein [Stellaceae bacterium]|nr:serine hydrolase domain-containing protein [Stellaceae bacterium]